MLTLTRKSGEQIRIGDEIVITVKEICGGQVKIGIEAPRSIHVYREELFAKIAESNRAAAEVSLHAIDQLECAGPRKP